MKQRKKKQRDDSEDESGPPLFHYTWFMEYCTYDGIVETAKGEVLANSRDHLHEHLEWMAETDFAAAVVYSVEVHQKTAGTTRDPKGCSIMFLKGPYPSYIEDDDEVYDVPWDEGPEDDEVEIVTIEKDEGGKETVLRASNKDASFVEVYPEASFIASNSGFEVEIPTDKS